MPHSVDVVAAFAERGAPCAAALRLARIKVEVKKTQCRAVEVHHFVSFNAFKIDRDVVSLFKSDAV